jgi:uncharacterized membrane protein
LSWTKTFDVPADGPDAALVYIVRRARLRYSRLHINRAILDHRDPNSLLALVEVAQALGLTTKAVRADLAALEELTFPAIVHFGRSGGDGGFGVLEGISPDGFRLWDSVNGERTVARELFALDWSGIVVLVERGAEDGPPEKGYLGRRLIEVVAGRRQRPALVGERADPYLRGSVLLLLSVLLCLSVALAPSPQRVAVALLVIAAVIGTTVSLVTVSLTSNQGPASLKICGRGKLIDCEGVLTSRYSQVFGIPLSEVGLAFFAALLLLLATGPLIADRPSVPAAAGIAYLATIPFSVALIGVQISMRQLCTLCLAIHVVNLSGAATSLLMLRDLEPSLIGTVAGLLLMALLFLIVLFLVVPHAVDISQIDKQVDALRRIQASPFATLAQVLSQTPLDLRGAECGISVSSLVPASPQKHELLVFVHPGCSRCWMVMQEMGNLAATGRVDIYLAVAPKDDDENDHKLCSAVIATGLRGGPRAAFQAYLAAKAYLSQPGSRRADDPIEAVIGALDEAPPTEDDFRLAGRLVRVAGELAQSHTGGTPAMFLDGHPVSAPPAHLAFLLSDHPDLLEPLLLARRAHGQDSNEEAAS